MRNHLIRQTWALALLALSAACATRGAERVATPLLASLQVTTAGDSVHFLLQVTNTGTEPVPLEFVTDPAFFFTVARDQLPLWNSAPDVAPLESVVTDTLGPGDTRSYGASWGVPMGLRGTITVTGVLRDRREPLVQSTRFSIP